MIGQLAAAPDQVQEGAKRRQHVRNMKPVCEARRRKEEKKGMVKRENDMQTCGRGMVVATEPNPGILSFPRLPGYLNCFFFPPFSL